ncbi:MAG: glycogen/starch synthase, partial [Verrucomicrobiota bacterium]
MRILLASSEVHPYSKTGGLADMVGALARTLAGQGHRVGVVTPLYAGIRERFPAVKQLDLA